MKPGNIHVFHGERGFGIQRPLDTCCELTRVRRVECKGGLRTINRMRDPGHGSCKRSALGERKDLRRRRALGILLETLHPVFLDRIVQKRERKPIVKEASAGANHPWPPAVRLPGNAEPRGEIMRYC